MMNSREILKYSIILVVIIGLGLIVGSIVNDSSSSNVENDEIVIGMIPKVIGSSYFELCKDGASLAAEELNIKLIYKGPTSADAASQVNIIQDMIFQDVDIIAISPIDPVAVEPMLKKATDKGILVVTYDADVAIDSREMFVSQVSEEALGKHLMNNLAEGIGEKGQFAILTASLTASNQNNWIKWMEEQMKEQYPELELVSIIPTDEDQQEAFVQTQNLIQAYPDLDGIVALSTVAVPGAARAIELLDVSGEVKLYGLGLPNDISQYLHNGSVQLGTLWNPEELGYLTVYVANDLLSGTTVETGNQYGKLNPIEVNLEEAVVIMGKPLDFTKENVDDYDF